MDHHFKKDQDNEQQLDSGYGDSFGSFTDETTEIQESISNLQIDQQQRNVQQEREKIIQLLRQAFTPDEDNDTYLHLFIARGLEEKALQLIKICPQEELLNVQNNLGQTALHVATYVNFHKVAAELVLNGADLEYVDKDGRNVFHLCAQRGHIETFNSIIKAACQTKQIEKIKTLINERDFQGLTPFYLAVTNKEESICKKMIDMKVDVNLWDSRNGNSPLHEAIVDPDSDYMFINFLIKYCAVNVNHQNYAGITPLHCAAGKGDTELFSLLISSGADTNLVDISGNIPVAYGNEAMVSIMAK